VEAFDQALSLRPDLSEAWYNEAVALISLDRTDEAIRLLCRAWRTREQLPDEGARVEESLRKVRYDPEEYG
jgi:tetratricopeptide (TPR) repeat protein